MYSTCSNDARNQEQARCVGMGLISSSYQSIATKRHRQAGEITVQQTYMQSSVSGREASLKSIHIVRSRKLNHCWRESRGERGPNNPGLPRGGTSSWGSVVGGVGAYRVSAKERQVSKGSNASKPQTLTFPLGPRRDGGPRFRLRGWRGWLLSLFLARSLLDCSPSWTSRFGRRRSFRRGWIFRWSRWSRWSSARWPGTAIVSGIGLPIRGTRY